MRRKARVRWPGRLSSRRDRVKVDLDDELAYHFEESVKNLVARGLSHSDAVTETKRRFGDVTCYRRKLERIDRNRAAEAASRGWVRVMGVLQDVRHGARILIHHRSFTLVAVLSLALGVGANTAIFSLVNSLLMRPLNVTEPERLVTVFTSRSGGQLHGNTSYPDFLDYREQNTAFSGLVAYTLAPMAISGPDRPAVLWGQLVSWDYFSVLGVEPRMGRAFLPEEDETLGANAVTVLSHGTWQDRFGSDPEIVGKTIRINDYPFTVIGVAPEGFTGLVSVLTPALWAPLTMVGQALPYTPNVPSRIDPWLQLVGRLRPGVTRSDAQASLNVLAANLATAYPDLNAGKGIVVEDLIAGRLVTPEATGGAKRLLAVLFGVVGFVLLVANINRCRARNDAPPARAYGDAGDRAGGLRAARCVLQRGQSAARQGDGPTPRNRTAFFARRIPLAHRAAASN